MAVIIKGVEAGSLAARKGIRPGDTLEAINGEAIRDVLDYRFYMTDSRLELSLRRDGAAFSVPVRKGEYDDLGLEFETYLMDRQHTCRNKCIFCFVDQLPRGLRDSLYVKDDDSRMSFLFGSYVTLTNLTEEDIRRIIKMRLSPINISVHTTDPDLRVEMLKNPKAAESLRYIPMLTQAGIRVNTQLVLCPGVNDGPALEKSLWDLAEYWPGLGEHRPGASGPHRPPGGALPPAALHKRGGPAGAGRRRPLPSGDDPKARFPHRLPRRRVLSAGGKAHPPGGILRGL